MVFTADFHNIYHNFPQACNQVSSGVEEERDLRLFLDQARRQDTLLNLLAGWTCFPLRG